MGPITWLTREGALCLGLRRPNSSCPLYPNPHTASLVKAEFIAYGASIRSLWLLESPLSMLLHLTF